MTSKRLTILAAGLGMLLAVGTVGSAYAWTKNFSGTRDQVRTACANVGGNLIEGANDTTCLNKSNGTGVQCDDKGQCAGYGPRISSLGIFQMPGLSGGMNYMPGGSTIGQDHGTSAGNSGGGVIIY